MGYLEGGLLLYKYFTSMGVKPLPLLLLLAGLGSQCRVQGVFKEYNTQLRGRLVGLGTLSGGTN